MSSVTQITDHVARAIARFVQQYRNKIKLEKLTEAFVTQHQDIEDAAFDMFTSRALDFAVGQQLDNFGTIVLQGREGFGDDFYRVLLQAQIGINNSSGEPKSVINTMKLLSQASLVFYQNLGELSVGLGVDTEIDASLIDFVYSNMQRVVMAGVRIDFITKFDADEPFSFDGTGPIGLGFSSLGAPTTGGKLAFLQRRTSPKFAFGSVGGAGDASSAGFGTVADPLAGGLMQGL